MNEQSKGLQWRRVDDRLVSSCLGIVENTEACQPRIIEVMQRFGITNNDDAINAFISWKIHILDRMQEEYDKNGWKDEYDDKPGSLVPHRQLRSPSDIQKQELKDSIEYSKKS